ncbi:redox-active disulfide protein 2 [Spirosoma pollinicola]|uniref:Redox-active disulfide protein 2 n=1 Tax=Spirosoma pollinicola TaxID=2057025 RepID=A0A2K8YW84_9BACT|nr:redox-active disulfide protein 2 [Spirosoma pollinicola]AUD01887.1 redox-active disulfide protein 2 [Spirosoma pollinicola]
MKNKNLSEMDSEALLKQEKSIKFLTGILIGALIALLAIGIISAYKNGQYTFIILPLALLPIVFLNINNLKEIKKEITSRRNML